MTAPIDVAMGFDARYAPHAAAVIASVVHNAPGTRFRFIIVHDGVERVRQAQVESVAPGHAFVWAQVADADLPQFQNGHLNRAVLFRLGLEKLAPTDSNRLVYIDADTVVLGDVRELAAAELGDSPIGAVLDRYVDAAKFAGQWGLPPEAPRYFNSGVMVVDLDKVRAEGLFAAAIDFVAANRDAVFYGDQDALNYVLWNRWRPLDPAWNVQSFAPVRELAASGRGPALIHFIGLEKPWLPNIWHPWAWAYWRALKHTPFAAEVARTYKMDLFQRTRLRVKWWLNRPPSPRLA